MIIQVILTNQESGSEEYQTDELQDNFVAENHEENGYPKPTKLIKFK